MLVIQLFRQMSERRNTESTRMGNDKHSISVRSEFYQCTIGNFTIGTIRVGCHWLSLVSLAAIG